MITLCKILLPIDRLNAIPVNFGKTIKPISVIDKVIEVDVASNITIVSTDSNIVFRVLYFCISLFIYDLSLK